MKLLRVLSRLIVFTIVTAAGYSFAILTSPFVRAARGSSVRWRAGLFRTWSRIVLRILGMRVEVAGAPPEPPFFLVSNHLSGLDIVVLSSRLRSVFVSKAEVSTWPIVGALCRSMNTLFIDRGSKRDIPAVIERIGEVMQLGVGVVVFPEGTNSDGTFVMKFKPALLEAAARARLPVAYASLTYRVSGDNRSAAAAVCWGDDTSFARHVWNIFAERRLCAAIEFGAGRIQDRDRKVLAARLHEAVAERFQPLGEPRESPSPASGPVPAARR